MNPTYSKIWKLAKPLYKNGRPMDIAHITWMIKEAEKIAKNDRIDESIFMPLVILHDVGYSAGEPVYFNKAKKGAHMKAGAKIAEKILRKINYPSKKIKKIAHFISIHDNWIYGEWHIYKKDKALGALKDLDFLWMLTPNIFRRMCGKIKKDKNIYLGKKVTDERELLGELTSEAEGRGFHTKGAKNLYNKYLKGLKKKVR